MAQQTSEVPQFPSLPAPGTFAPKFAPVVDSPKEPDITPNFIAMAKAVASICATRILLLLAVLFSGASLIWTIAQPTELRIVAATSYAAVVIWPLVVLHWRRG